MTDNKMPAILSGDGKTPQTSVLFEVCSLAARVAAERRFICDRFGVEGLDWSAGMHFAQIPGVFEDCGPPQDGDSLFDLAVGAARKVTDGDAEQDKDSGLISHWNIDLRDGTSTSVYFDTSNTTYPED